VIEVPFVELNLEFSDLIAPNFHDFLRLIQTRPMDVTVHRKHQKKLRAGYEIWLNQSNVLRRPPSAAGESPVLSRKSHAVYLNKNAQNFRAIMDGGIPQW
jgi:hypothetical protein